MTRKKVVLERISNESARKATYKKRKKGLMKKVSELSTLCGINACAVIYSPYDPHPEIWPPSPAAVLTRFKEIPVMEQRKKMLNHEGFLCQRITNANDPLRKMGMDNREKEMTHIMYQCLTGKELLQTLDLMDLNDLGGVIDHTVKEIDRRVEILRAAYPKPQQSHVPSPRDGTPAAGDVAAMPRQPWYMNYALPAQMDWNIGPAGEGRSIQCSITRDDDKNAKDGALASQERRRAPFTIPCYYHIYNKVNN